jgi:hypothetical protein
MCLLEGKEGETDHRRQKHNLGKKKWIEACRPFGTSSLKEGAV